MSKSVYCVLGTHKAFTSKAQAYSYAALVDQRRAERGLDWDGDSATEVFGFDVNTYATEVWVASCWSERDRTEYHFQAPEGRGDCYIIQ